MIASRAAIPGAFSIARQAVKPGFLPRLEITHTSDTHCGQIYLPKINMFLMIGVFLTAAPAIAPPALMHNLKHNHVLHATNLIVKVMIANSPRPGSGWSRPVSAIWRNPTSPAPWPCCAARG